MKLRQKLAAALATAMVVTSVPVLTTAASTNTITRPSTIISKGGSYNTAATAPAVKINFDSFEAGEEFYLTLTNAEWNKSTNTVTQGGDTYYTIVERVDNGHGVITENPVDDGTNVKIEYVSPKVIKVVVNSIPRSGELSASATKDMMKIPMLVTLKGEEATVAITTEGSNSTVTEGTYKFATTTSEVATATVASPSSISKEGKLGTITIAEAFAGAMQTTDGSNYYALIEMNEEDFKFDLSHRASTKDAGYERVSNGDKIDFVKTNDATKVLYDKYTVNATFTYGFSGTTHNTVDVFVSPEGDSMYVELRNDLAANSKGRIELNDLYVQSTVKNPQEGNITVDVSGNVSKVQDLVVAVNGNYGAKLTVADDKKVEILAGEAEEVIFSLTETVDGTFTKGRSIEVKADNGYFMVAELDAKNKVDETKTLDTFRTKFASIMHNTSKVAATDVIKSVEIENGKVIGFTFNVADIQTANVLDTVTFKLNVLAGIEQSGEVKLSAESRDFDETITGVVAEIRSAVEIASEQVVLKTGLMNQVGGKITITEKEAGVLNRSEQVIVNLPKVNGITFSDAKNELPEVKVTAGDVQVSDVKIIEGANGEQALQLTIKRNSNEASTIEIANFHIDTDRTVAEGTYDVEIGGAALTDHAETIEVKDFIKIGTANTEDLMGANGLAKGVSKFVIGESKYTVNGVEKTMDAKSYAQAPGYTMVPVRYVAEAFGVTGNNILFSNGTATFFAGTRTIQLTNNSDIAVVNGVQIKMATKVVMKEGRTYAPIGEIANLLGISKSWDSTTKTATFINK